MIITAAHLAAAAERCPAGTVLAQTDRLYVKTLTPPMFHPADWPACLDGEGIWTAVANVNGTVSVVKLGITFDAPPS